MTDQSDNVTVTTEDLDAPAIENTSTQVVSDQVVSEAMETVEQEKPKTTGSTKKILLVEDEKPLAKALESKLNSSGFSATAVFNGEEALKLLEKDTFDLVITDLLMPIMDGWDLLKKLQEQKGMPTVIVLSNLGQSEDLDKAKQLNAKDFWIKSDLSLAEIVSRVQKELA